jgi:hypothetical protein
MKTVRFNTTIGDDRVIRAPAGVDLTPGEAEVIVVQMDRGAPEQARQGPNLRDRLSLAARELGIRDLPADLAINHDHYAHGTAMGIDQP